MLLLSWVREKQVNPLKHSPESLAFSKHLICHFPKHYEVENEMIVPREEMGVGFMVSRQWKGKSLCLKVAHVFPGLGVLLVLKQKLEDTLVIGLVLFLPQVSPQAIWYGE